uniref:Uncharacterized protein n=1 Tax=Panagrolaimus superbus TaxID=310955 RepID=A0A914YJD9_9BILA
MARGSPPTSRNWPPTPTKAARRPLPAKRRPIAYLSKQFADAGLQPGGDLKDGKRLWTPGRAAEQGRHRRRTAAGTAPGRQDRRAGAGQADRRARRHERRQQRRHQQGPAGVPRLRRESPGAQLGRLQGRGPEKGKIAVVLINDPDFETGQGDFDGKGMTY